ncbi:hypothetical protein PNOK_0273700 [Pyrrhoderma noxium]|uniref:Uncharacterized protein n=1 Tax=Pyrrhoderma noxium TaxID=2282107 RepID=A0A286UT62_9AGAM|nr:hypothetical protein PNOK_0273700 [Pyrrhoderma noxium]
MILTKTINQRQPTLINLLICWTIYSTSNLIVFYAGQAQETMPDFGLCLVQASMIYASTVMISAATLALILQLWFNIRNICCSESKSRAKVLTLLSIPWISFLAFFIGCVAYGATKPLSVSKRWVFYCTISSDEIIYTVCTFTLLFLALTIGFQAFVLRFLIRSSKHTRTSVRPLYHLVIRVTVFTIYSLLTFIMGIVVVLRPTTKLAYIIISTLPLAAFLVFGTQEEHIRFWFRIKPKSKKSVSESAITFKPAIVSNETFELRSDKSLPLVNDYANPA